MHCNGDTCIFGRPFFRKSASRGFEPTLDFGCPFPGLRQWWLPLRHNRGCGLRVATSRRCPTGRGWRSKAEIPPWMTGKVKRNFHFTYLNASLDMWSKYPRRHFRPGYMFRFLPFSGYAFYAKLRVLVHHELPKTPLKLP